MIGKTILHYKIIEKLGEGGMGIVYLAEDTKLDRKVAIKFLPGHIAGNSDERKRFEVEAKAAAALNHPNIATIHAIETVDDEMFIVMEYIEGRELKDIINDPVSPLIKGGLRGVLDIARQIARGLEAAHEKNIIHRDIKSTNIMITAKGQVKIMDFGLAKVRGGIELTKEQSTIGTAAYMSPEQARGDAVDQRSDIWSFGVVFYEMLTGVFPFKGDYDQAIVYAILNEEPDDPVSLNKTIPANLGAVVNKMLAKDRNERYDDMDEVLEQLTTLTGPQSTGRVIYLTFGSVLIVLVFILYYVWNPTPDKTGPENPRIAVLPIANTRPDPESDYLGFALADEIIGDLSYLKNVMVRSSSSVRKYQKQTSDPVAAGNDLNVDYILTGNFLKEANLIRLNVELIEIHRNEMIWRDQIEVDYKSAFELQDIVAERVVRELDKKFSREEIERIKQDKPADPLAYQYYLQGISYPYSNKGDRLAIDKLNKSITLDSTFAPAYAHLANRIHRLTIYGLEIVEGSKKAERYYLKSLMLNNELIYALANLAQIYTETSRTEQGVELIRQSLEINPNNPEALFSLGYIYRYTGMNEEAVDLMEKAVNLDPGNPGFRSILITYLFSGRYEKVIEAAKQFGESPFVWGQIGATLMRMGDRQKAVKYFNRWIEEEPNGARWVEAMKAYVEGNIEHGIEVTRKWEQFDLPDAEAWFHMAQNYALLGDSESCNRALEQAIRMGFFNYPWMTRDPFLDSTREDPEFRRILRKAKEKHLSFKNKFFPQKS
jgi:serine/threonine protein kinase/Flp pilus assembly protein TadD